MKDEKCHSDISLDDNKLSVMSDNKIITKCLMSYFFSNYLVPQCCHQREDFSNTSEISAFLGNPIKLSSQESDLKS